MGDNILKESTNIDWWAGMDVEYDKEIIQCGAAFDVLTEAVPPPPKKNHSCTNAHAHLWQLHDQGCWQRAGGTHQESSTRKGSRLLAHS